jgi:predicted O-linked N-acetylglucosamine transferase (SPINDLY family)
LVLLCAPKARRIEMTVPIAPFDLAEAVQRAIAAYQRGARDEAEWLCRQVLETKADHFGALYLLGIIAARMQRTQEAVELLGRAVAADPANAVAHRNYGMALQELKRLDEALASYDHALRIKPDYAEAHYNRGVLLQELKRLDEAMASYDRALAFKPDHAAAYYNRGIALKELKRLDEAVDSYENAIALKPDFAEGYYNRGNTLLELNRLEEALDSYDRALKINPHYAEAHNNRADTLGRLHRHLEAAQCLTRLLELEPAFSFAKGNLLHAKMRCCDWADLGDLCESIGEDILVRKRSATPFGYQAICNSEQDLRTCAEVYAAEKFPPKSVRIHSKTKEHEKIRLGYLSGEFRQQATAVLMAELFELHDRNRFEIVAFDNGWDDGSEIRTRINKAFNEIVDIRRMPDLDAASLIKAKEIDILVNLNGYFGEARQGVFSYKPSPIQVNYLGFPGTMGAEYIDYLIADRTLIPNTSQQHYSEKIAYLPNCYQVNDRKRPIADKAFSREELGLPQAGFVFCCFNNNYKITPGTFDGWMRILKQVNGSVLWLLEDNPAAARNLRKEAGARGVSAERLIFGERMSSPEHLARHRAADLFIDTLPYNAHTTASDALWAGLPLLTCTGQTFPGRVAASLLNAIGLPELVTTTQAQYEALAVDLANHPQQLTKIKHKLELNRLTTPLFDTPLFSRHIEEGYTQMYERYQKDLPPDHIYVA